ncbi:MAG: type II toxin-antitoxin system RelB/DinJ family antitoxin [Syntrophomonas sp.]
MAKTADINIRIDPETKTRVERLFAKFGITVTDTVNIFLHQSLMVGGEFLDDSRINDADIEDREVFGMMAVKGKWAESIYRYI